VRERSAEYWKDQAESWREEFERMVKIRDSLLVENRRMLKAIRVVYAHLNARLDAAPPERVPVFEGIAELHSIVRHFEGVE
jgi:hypothetical protein